MLYSMEYGGNMRTIILICVLFFSLPAMADVFLVPGWRTGFSGRDGCVRIMKDVFPGKKIVVKSWDSLQPWHITKRNARVQTEKLLMEILAMPENDRRELILVGHSIGAQIVVDILCELARRKMKIHSVSLLGGALPDDDPRISGSLEAIRFYCTIVYNPDDWVLKYLFPLDNSMHAPLGLNGWSGSDHRVFEARTHSDRFGFCNHFAYIYLEELDRLMSRIPPERPEVKVIQDEINIERVPADNICWDTILSHGGWKLQKNCTGGLCRILDDHCVRRAWGSEDKMRESFADLCRQLDGK